MKLDSDGNLKKCRVKTLPIKVPSLAGKSEILEKAIRKHCNHDKDVLGELEHVLLNGDGNEITTLPGTNDEFVLSKYREDIGRNYNHITLYIALRSSFLQAEMSKMKRLCWDSDTDSESSCMVDDRCDRNVILSVSPTNGNNPSTSRQHSELQDVVSPSHESNPPTSYLCNADQPHRMPYMS